MQVWQSREVKNVSLAILSQYKDGSFEVTFEIDRLNPRRTYRYETWYISKYYKYVYDINWKIED